MHASSTHYDAARRRPATGLCRAAVIGLAVVGLAAPSGCASYRGAELYLSGTRALDAGDTTTAIADLERAAELVPHASEVQNHLGAAYLASGRRDDARAAFVRAVDLDCDNAAARANLALLDGGAGAP